MKNIYRALYSLGWLVWLYCVVVLLFGKYFPFELTGEYAFRYYLLVACCFPISFWLMMFRAGFSAKLSKRRGSYMSEKLLLSVLLFPVGMLMVFANTTTTLQTRDVLLVNKVNPQISIVEAVWNYGLHSPGQEPVQLFKRIHLLGHLNLIFETDTAGLDRNLYQKPHQHEVSNRLY